jgi:hypothetical protein
LQQSASSENPLEAAVVEADKMFQSTFFFSFFLPVFIGICVWIKLSVSPKHVRANRWLSNLRELTAILNDFQNTHARGNSVRTNEKGGIIFSKRLFFLAEPPFEVFFSSFFFFFFGCFRARSQFLS